MPGLNGKGPLGDGPMTGRGLGRCRTGANPADQRQFNDQLKRIDPENYNANTAPADNTTVYGRGRGGQPYGGGACRAQGRGPGGPGSGRGQGRGRGRGFRQ